MINKRTFLTSLLAGVTALPGMSLNTLANVRSDLPGGAIGLDQSSRSLAGLWSATVTGPNQTYKVVTTFTSDGRATALIWVPGDPSVRGIGLGEWANIRSREFSLTGLGLWLDEAEVKIQARVTLNQRLEEASIELTLSALGPNGQVVQSFQATGKGQRIRAGR